jgi:hypothetical protein
MIFVDREKPSPWHEWFYCPGHRSSVPAAVWNRRLIDPSPENQLRMCEPPPHGDPHCTGPDNIHCRGLEIKYPVQILAAGARPRCLLSNSKAIIEHFVHGDGACDMSWSRSCWTDACRGCGCRLTVPCSAGGGGQWKGDIICGECSAVVCRRTARYQATARAGRRQG